LSCQRPHRPFLCFEAVLRMRIKFSGNLDEAFAVQSAARFVSRMIAPDPQRHPITSIGQTQFAVRLLLARELRRRGFDLDVHARRNRAALCGPANFAQCHQLHVDRGGVAQSLIGGVDYTAGDSRSGIAGRIRLQVVLFLVNDNGSSDD